MMEITFLGTGTSMGVPEINCPCEVCHSTDPKDKRLRASILITVVGKQLLVDCGPDLRQQLLRQPTDQIDGVLITHAHYDHVGGLDDLRNFCRDHNLPIYAKPDVVENLLARTPYCFNHSNYPGIPNLELIPIPAHPFTVAGIEVTPIEVMHYKLPITGYRIGNVAYITDMLRIDPAEEEKLKGLDLLIVNALRITPHISHQSLPEALALIERIAPKECYLTHMSHQIGLHQVVSAQLPPHVHLAYDTLKLTSPQFKQI